MALTLKKINYAMAVPLFIGNIMICNSHLMIHVSLFGIPQALLTHSPVPFSIPGNEPGFES